jgi:hypothetical protein
VSEFKGDSPSIHRPQLLLAFNNNGVWRPKSLSQTFQDGASSVNKAIASLRAEVHELKRDTCAQFESNQLATSAVAKSVSTLHSTVDSLHTGRRSALGMVIWHYVQGFADHNRWAHDSAGRALGSETGDTVKYR